MIDVLSTIYCPSNEESCQNDTKKYNKVKNHIYWRVVNLFLLNLWIPLPPNPFLTMALRNVSNGCRPRARTRDTLSSPYIQSRPTSARTCIRGTLFYLSNLRQNKWHNVSYISIYNWHLQYTELDCTYVIKSVQYTHSANCTDTVGAVYSAVY